MRSRASRQRRHSSARMRRISIERGYGITRRQSPVRPSQQPILNRQRGHWNVPCRHSIAAPQRRHCSVAADCFVSAARGVVIALDDTTPAGRAGGRGSGGAPRPPRGRPPCAGDAALEPPGPAPFPAYPCRLTGNETSRRVEIPPSRSPPGPRARTKITSSCCRGDAGNPRVDSCAALAHPSVPVVASGGHGEHVVRHRGDVHQCPLDGLAATCRDAVPRDDGARRG